MKAAIYDEAGAPRELHEGKQADIQEQIDEFVKGGAWTWRWLPDEIYVLQKVPPTSDLPKPEDAPW